MINFSREKLVRSEIFYKYIFGGILSNDEGIDAESLTNLSLGVLEKICMNRNSYLSSIILNTLKNDLVIKDNRLEQNLFGCTFQNPIGLAAGFDKNGVAAAIWDKFGFGFAELGTITWHSQKGNSKPRLFRLSKEQAALNRMGFNNKGANEIQRILHRQGLIKRGLMPVPIGLNFGKSKIVELSEAKNDYALSINLLGRLADYAVINISSPNTPGLRELQSPIAIEKLFNTLKSISECPPLLIKIAPDLSNKEIDMICEIAISENIAGIIATNTSINRLGLDHRKIKGTGLTLKEESGGLSGSPLRARALYVMKRLHERTKNKVHLIGVGGIDSPSAAWERITAGASLVQIYTGWIFKGPILVPEIMKGIGKQLEIHGFKNISEAIGSQAPWK